MNTEEMKAQAFGVLDHGKEKAAAFLEDGGKMDQLLIQAEKKLASVPKAGEFMADLPRMISLLKDYIQKDYQDAPKASLVAMVAALIYLVNPKDIIPDSLIGIGQIDDAAVLGACIKLTKKDLDAYGAWRDAKVVVAKDEESEPEA